MVRAPSTWPDIHWDLAAMSHRISARGQYLTALAKWLSRMSVVPATHYCTPSFISLDSISNGVQYVYGGIHLDAEITPCI